MRTATLRCICSWPQLNPLCPLHGDPRDTNLLRRGDRRERLQATAGEIVYGLGILAFVAAMLALTAYGSEWFAR